MARLTEIDVMTPQGIPTTNVEEALARGREIGYPCMARVAYALGGLGSGICGNEEELRELATRAFAHYRAASGRGIPERLERDRVRGRPRRLRQLHHRVQHGEPRPDGDPHRGEHRRRPSQTLTNDEYHQLREVAIRVVRHLGIVGECNIQYALSPRVRATG